MKCPVCKIVMQHYVYEGTEIHHCLNCYGHWLAKEALQNSVAVRQVLFDQEESIRLARSMPGRSVSDGERDRLMACPSCHQDILARRYADDSPITLNRCSACQGIWLDHLELEHVQMFVEGIIHLQAHQK